MRHDVTADVGVFGGSGFYAFLADPEDDSVAVLKVCPHCGTEYETAARFCPADGTSLRPKG